MSSTWSGRAVTRARAIVATWLPSPCGKCGHTVNADDAWVVGHKVARSLRPDLTFEISNWHAEHKRCSDSSGQTAVIEKAKANGASFPQPTSPRQAPPLSVSPSRGQGTPLNVRSELSWTRHSRGAPAWLRPVLQVPAEAAAPLAMTGVHPDAVGSYGLDAIDWIGSEFGIRLRWWQRLALVRILEHRVDGSLCWRTVVFSASRRSGKSVLLRALACWRLAHAHLFQEVQTCVHTGSDVAICREVQRGAWRWAEEVAGWTVSRANGKEALETPDGDRWLVRAQSAVYGYDATVALADECWDIPAAVIDDGLEPSMLERVSPQLLLCSTAHRKATSLMRKRLADALAQDDGQTLLLLWAARPQDDPSDVSTWRAASPHWSADRERTIGAKYERALAGEADPTMDDPDPLRGWASQYLNIWRLGETRAQRGEPVVSEGDWAELVTEVPDGCPKAASVESWFAGGMSLAVAWQGEVRTVVQTSHHQDLASAVAALRASGFTGQLQVGESLAKHPALKGVRVKPVRETLRSCVADLTRLLAEGAVGHDGGEQLTTQVLALRTAPGVDGPRMQSSGPADAVKAAVWAVKAARAVGTGKPRILLASAS